MKGWGDLHRRRDGWQVDCYVDGRRVRRSYPSKELAEKALKVLREQRALAGLGVRTEPEAHLLTYADLAPALRDAYQAAGHTDRTLESYRGELAAVLEDWGPRRVAATRPSEIHAWIRKLQRRGLSPSAIRHRCDRLSQLHKAAEEHLPAAPCRVPRPALVTEERAQVTETELAAILKAAGQGFDRRPLAGLLLASDAGLRASEIVALEARDIREGWIDVRRGKGRRARSIPILTRRLQAALDGLRTRQGRLLGVDTNDRLYGLLRPAWRAVRPRDRYPQLHALRHRFATVAVSAPDAVLDDVRRWLGHTGLATTSRYVHLRPPVLPPGVGEALERSPDGHRGPAGGRVAGRRIRPK